MTIANTFDQLVTAAREALAALDEQDALLVQQLRSMACEAEQRAEQRRRIEACLDALVPVSLTPAVSEAVEEPTPAAAAVPPQPYDSPPIEPVHPSLVIRQMPDTVARGGRRFCPACGGGYTSRIHMATCKDGKTAIGTDHKVHERIVRSGHPGLCGVCAHGSNSRYHREQCPSRQPVTLTDQRAAVEAVDRMLQPVAEQPRVADANAKADQLVRAAAQSMICPKCNNHFASKAHRDACRKGTAAVPLDRAPAAVGA